MWIFTEWGFFSVTQTPDNKDLIQIRARARGHLQNLKKAFPILERSKIVVTPDADYRFRVVCRRWRWEKLATDMATKITYSNFKGRVQAAGWAKDMLGLLHDVWHLCHRFQEKLHPKVKPMRGEPVLFADARDREGLFDDTDEPPPPATVEAAPAATSE